MHRLQTRCFVDFYIVLCVFLVLELSIVLEGDISLVLCSFLGSTNPANVQAMAQCSFPDNS